jgi:hypothetical protein
MGLLTRILRPSGPTHGRCPCSSLPSRGVLVPMVPNLISNPRVPSALFHLGILIEYYLALVEY